MDRQGSAHWSAYVSAYRDLADLCLWGGLNAVSVAQSPQKYKYGGCASGGWWCECESEDGHSVPPSLMATRCAQPKASRVNSRGEVAGVQRMRMPAACTAGVRGKAGTCGPGGHEGAGCLGDALLRRAGKAGRAGERSSG
jgi:hypothetical protein